MCCVSVCSCIACLLLCLSCACVCDWVSVCDCVCVCLCLWLSECACVFLCMCMCVLYFTCIRTPTQQFWTGAICLLASLDLMQHSFEEMGCATILDMPSVKKATTFSSTLRSQRFNCYVSVIFLCELPSTYLCCMRAAVNGAHQRTLAAQLPSLN